MDDLYGKKAKKYKNKYLKLKKEYIAKGGMYGMQQHFAQPNQYPHFAQPNQYPQFTQPNQYPQFAQPNNFVIQRPQFTNQSHSHPYPHSHPHPQRHQNQSNKNFIETGSYSCVLHPPIQFKNNLILNRIPLQFKNNQIVISKQYNYNSKTNENFYTEKYIGKILRIFWYLIEFEQYIKIEELQIISKHIPKLIFAGIIDKSEIQNQFRYQDTFKYKKCFDKKQLDESQVGYIITNYLGNTIENLLKSNININIKSILTSLVNGINEFISKIYTNNIIHCDIHLGNLTLNNNNTVCFIDFGTMHYIHKLEKYIPYQPINHNDINQFYMNIYKNSINTPFILSYLYNNKNNRTNIINSIRSNLPQYKNNIQFNDIRVHYDNIKKIFISHKYYFPNLIDINKRYYTFEEFIINYVNNLTKIDNFYICNDSEYHNNVIYPIEKNVDIYSLSVTIFKLFNNSQKQVKPNVLLEVCILYIDALQNKIAGPSALISKINKIIELL